MYKRQVGTLIGAIFISVLQNGLTILNVNTYWQQVCMGVVLLLAVGLDPVSYTHLDVYKRQPLLP